jgi:hypothetical protein
LPHIIDSIACKFRDDEIINLADWTDEVPVQVFIKNVNRTVTALEWVIYRIKQKLRSGWTNLRLGADTTGTKEKKHGES